MSGVFVCGCGAVSPAGWGVVPLRESLARGEPISIRDLPRPGWTTPLRVRTVPPPSPRPPFLSHPRLRRTSPIAHYAVAAALEALGEDAPKMPGAPASLPASISTRDHLRPERLGVVLCVMSGCVNY